MKTITDPITGRMETVPDAPGESPRELQAAVARSRRELRDMLSGATPFHNDSFSKEEPINEAQSSRPDQKINPWEYLLTEDEYKAEGQVDESYNQSTVDGAYPGHLILSDFSRLCRERERERQHERERRAAEMDRCGTSQRGDGTIVLSFVPLADDEA